MQETLALALWQTPYLGTSAQSLARLAMMAARAQAQGADLLLCPEMGLTGYAIGPDRVATLAEPADGPLAQAVSAMAQRHGIAIVCADPERHPNGAKPFNATQATGPHGEALGHYRKTHLYGELTTPSSAWAAPHRRYLSGGVGGWAC